MRFRNENGHTYLPEEEYKMYSSLRGYPSLIDDFATFIFAELDLDGKMWLELDTIQPQDMRDAILADLKELQHEEKS